MRGGYHGACAGNNLRPSRTPLLGPIGPRFSSPPPSVGRLRPPSSLWAASLCLRRSKRAIKALSALMLPLPSVPVLSPLHKAEEHRIGLHFRGPERTSEGQTDQRPHA